MVNVTSGTLQLFSLIAAGGFIAFVILLIAIYLPTLFDGIGDE